MSDYTPNYTADAIKEKHQGEDEEVRRYGEEIKQYSKKELEDEIVRNNRSINDENKDYIYFYKKGFDKISRIRHNAEIKDRVDVLNRKNKKIIQELLQRKNQSIGGKGKTNKTNKRNKTNKNKIKNKIKKRKSSKTMKNRK